MSQTKQLTFGISGMHCASCAANTQKKLLKTKGIKTAEVNFATKEATVAYDSEKLATKDLSEAVASLGYTAHLPEEHVHQHQSHQHDAGHDHDHLHHHQLPSLRLKLAVSLLLTTPLLLAMIPGMPTWLMDPRLQFILATPVQFWVGWQYYVSAWKAARNGMTNMDTLIVLGTSVAYFFSLAVLLFSAEFQRLGIETHVYFETSAAIITFILLGKYLEALATSQTSSAIEKLMDLQVKKARLITDNQEKMVDVISLHKNDLIKVKPGEKIPLDGVIVEGAAAIDESMVTGESLPVARQPGDQVIGSTLNTDGSLVVRVTKVGEETFLAQVVALVKAAQGSKAPIQKLVDKISAIFVPAVIILSLLTFVIWSIFGPEPAFIHALIAMVSVLIIACPCALGLATPVSIMVGVGRGASAGILIKNAENLEVAGKLTQLVFDKTGTLTEGKPTLQAIHYAKGVAEAQVNSAIASLETQSHHPLAKAIVEDLQGASLKKVTDFLDMPGQGISGTISAKKIYIGTAVFLQSQGFDLHPELMKKAIMLAQKGQTVSHVAVGGRHVAILGIADTLRVASKPVITTLKRMGITPILLTGDNRETARAVAKSLGITTVHAEVLPQDKQAIINRLKTKNDVVGMVGDGINDAPALAAADIGIAMGLGTDIAIETAGITLLRSDISLVPKAIRLSQATLKNIRENLIWAFGYNVILIPVAMGVLYPTFGIKLSPILASAAMAFSSVSVVLNALRLKRVDL